MVARSMTITGASDGSAICAVRVAVTMMGDSSAAWSALARPAAERAEIIFICRERDTGCFLFMRAPARDGDAVCGGRGGLMKTPARVARRDTVLLQPRGRSPGA